ncbi:MAG: hypothetical protein U0637_02035 [Phycisphaerales bacterium]
MTVAYVIMALCVLLGVPFTLWWWREADKWADAEHKRFKTKEDESMKHAIVVKWEKSAPPPADGPDKEA